MNRRGFLAALAGLPFVGKLIPKPKPHLSFNGVPIRLVDSFRYEPRTRLPEVKWRKLNEGVSPRRT